MIDATTALLLAAALTSVGCGVILGSYLTNKIYNDEVIKASAQLKADRDELNRIQLGIDQAWLDHEGKEIKLYTRSALSMMSEVQLRNLAAARGIIPGANWSQVEFIAAIEAQQKGRSRSNVHPIKARKLSESELNDEDDL